MAKPPQSTSNPETIEQHPAFLAWRVLGLASSAPHRIDRLKEKGKGPLRQGVYRLRGAGPGGSDVIAKRFSTRSAKVELIVFREILQRISVASPRHYGIVGEGNDPLAWVFLEDVTAEKYSLERPEHRELAALWLGAVHTGAARFAEAVSLPDRGPGHYLDEMQVAHDSIARHLDDPGVADTDRFLLQNILSHFDALRSRWNDIQAFCTRIPRTLVHGDLVARNVQVRANEMESALLPFDWGTTAGWGPPAVDLAQFTGSTLSPNLQVYCDTVQRHWQHLGIEDIQGLAEIGKIFRLIVSLRWESKSLGRAWTDGVISNMRIYETRLRPTIDVAESAWRPR